jgi:hypothetical protein
MSYLSNPAVWFSVGAYLCIFEVVMLLFTLIVKFKKYRKFGVTALFFGLVLSVSAILIGDWSIPECYNSEGKFTADDVKCIFQ